MIGMNVTEMIAGWWLPENWKTGHEIVKAIHPHLL